MYHMKCLTLSQECKEELQLKLQQEGGIAQGVLLISFPSVILRMILIS